MAKKKKKQSIKFKPLFIVLSIILFIVSIYFIYSLITLNMIPNKYIYIVVGLILLIDIVLSIIYIKVKRLGIKVLFILIGILLVLGEGYASYNINKTSSFVDNIVETVKKEEVYNIYVLSNSNIKSFNDFAGKKLGIFDNKSNTLDKAILSLKKKTTFKSETKYDDISLLLSDGISKKIDVIFISSSMEQLLNENYIDMFSQYKVLSTLSVPFKETIKKEDIDVLKKPFTVYISGIDTYGSIGRVSRSDVNILAVINPLTNKILLVNTPRDYYVKLHSKGAYDKLTHAGIYGVDESLKTIEDLYVTDINYYIRVNFSSMIKIVDAIGGITVDSKYAFSYDGYTFHKGTNKLNGKAALAFSRCRKELPKGDISRGENQERVIQAIIDKISSPSIITKYSSILNSLSRSFVTNMDQEDISKLAKNQLDKMPKWEVSTANVRGADAFRSTYSGGRTKLYVMIPDEVSITNAKQEINKTLGE